MRIGLSYAKGLCYGLQKPLVGVSNFEILAQAAPVAYEQLVTLIDARRGNWYLAVFSGDNSQIVNKVVVGSNELHQYISDDTVVVANTTVPEIKTRFILTKYSAGVLCKVGLHHYEMQGMDSIENLEPLYMQPFAGVI